ncbi:GtrA family protein [Brachybacterium huguangmaarense]|uniref:GtrA family protein n=1 Tax=Brachybacterium huguangmaarense TaxID=1652028 RepID=A0ABY6G2C9_9MICO|nr:GtrA family protein [Brachybacterium huguangmaarense]UYG17362.1 GtrA family protein [Brachybacterium huguangmaarense]
MPTPSPAAPSADAPSAGASRPDAAGRRAHHPGWQRGLVARHLGSSLKFLVVGGIVFLVDAATYNVLVFLDPVHGWGHGVLFDHPVTAKVLTIAFASVLTYLGNRLWTFADRPSPRTTRSIVAFVVVNLIATGLQLGCLAFSRYVLGLDSPLADNISGTLIGQVVSTSFRYVTYGRFVFPPHHSAHEADPRPQGRSDVPES